MSKKKKKGQNKTTQDNNIKTVIETSPKIKNTTLLSTIILSTISLISGFLIMVIELTSSRVLAPYYGNTIYCWTGVIGTILFAMSFGYLIGGIVVEKYKNNEKLLRILLMLSGITTSFIPLLASSLANFLNSYDSYTTGPIVASLLIFCIPAFCFAMIPPLCVKIISENVKMVGLASGIVSSTSALGSILGTFFTGFVLIPSLSLSQIYYFAAVIPFLLIFLTFVLGSSLKKENIVQFAIFLVISLPLWGFYNNIDIFPNLNIHGKEVYKNLNPYHLVRVYDNDYFFLLKLDSTQEGAMTKEGSELIFEYTKYWELIKCFKNADAMHKACFVGGGAFAIPSMFHQEFPEANIDAIEIDPELKIVGEKFFHIDPANEKLKLQIEDGRRWFRGKENEYDFIFLDAFHGVKSIPHHLVTAEYFAELHRSMTTQGVLAINVIARRKGEHSVFYRSFVKTIQQSFPTVIIFAVHPSRGNESSNLVIFASKEQEFNNALATQISKKLNLYNMYRNQVDIISSENIADYQADFIFTDEYAPVEYMVAQ